MPVASGENCESKVPTSADVFRIDSVGWDDTDVDDDETFREILRFICSNYLVTML
jgi:hypothetical protein